MSLAPGDFRPDLRVHLKMNKKIELSVMYTPWTIDTYNVFTFETHEEMEIEHMSEEFNKPLTYDDFEWTYNNKKFLEVLMGNWMEIIGDNIKDDVIKDITQDGEPWSPRYYNYSTDDCNIAFTVDLEKLKGWIKDHQEQYNQDKIKSVSGFIWLGDEEQTMLNYYLRAKSAVKDLTEGEYIMDQHERITEQLYTEDIIQYTLKK